MLDPWVPVLVTQPWRTVPKGTNGGMSLTGTTASVLAGLFMGVVFWASGPARDQDAPSQLPLVWIGAGAGFFGSLLDSLLGATVQATYYDEDKKQIVEHAPGGAAAGAAVVRVCGTAVLSNEMVNAVSVAATTFGTGWIASRLIP